MKSSHDDDAAVPVLQRMVNALDALMKLRDPAHKVSNGRLIIENLKKLQDAYHALDSDAKDIINSHLKAKNPGLFLALEKKGSKISKPFDLAVNLHDSLPEELKALIASNSVLRVMQISANPSYEVFEEDAVMPDTGTMVVNSGKGGGNQLNDALASAGRQMDPNLYAMFATSDPDAPQSSDPLTAAIQALETLIKTKMHKEKIQRGEPKPNGYDNAYREVLLKQFHVLHNHKDVFKRILQHPSNQKQLSQMIEILDKHAVAVPDMLKIAGEISALIDDRFVESLKGQYANTPRPK